MHDRRSTRLPGWDYSAEGDYFVTLCAHDRCPIFGHLANGRIELTDIGRIVADAWRWLPSQYAYVALDEWCLMPDHPHTNRSKNPRCQITRPGVCRHRLTRPVDTVLNAPISRPNVFRRVARSMGRVSVSAKQVGAVREPPLQPTRRTMS